MRLWTGFKWANHDGEWGITRLDTYHKFDVNNHHTTARALDVCSVLCLEPPRCVSWVKLTGSSHAVSYLGTFNYVSPLLRVLGAQTSFTGAGISSGLLRHCSQPSSSRKKLEISSSVCSLMPITVAAGCKVWTDFALSNTGVGDGWHPSGVILLHTVGHDHRHGCSRN